MQKSVYSMLTLFKERKEREEGERKKKTLATSLCRIVGKGVVPPGVASGQGTVHNQLVSISGSPCLISSITTHLPNPPKIFTQCLLTLFTYP